MASSHALLAAMLLSSAAGCTSVRDYVHHGFKVGPNYGRPPAPVADHWIDAGDARVRNDETEPCQWWDAFHDPVLSGLICSAYQQNLTLREAGFRVLAARAQAGIAIGEFFPQKQDFGASFNNNELSQAVANRGAIPQRFYGQWSLGFTAAWELDFWGRFRRAIEAAQDELDASVEGYDDVLVTLIGDVATNYVTIRVLEKQIGYARANVKLQQESLDIAKARFQGGQASELDVDQATSNLAQTQALLPQLEIELRRTANRLCVLLGIPPEDLQARLGAGSIPTTAPEIAIGVPADLVRRRPDVRRAEREAAAQSARIGIAEADFYPSISIVGSLAWKAEDFNDLFGPLSFNGVIGPTLQWNILNYGRILNNVHLQDARFQQKIANYQNTVLTAASEVETGLVTFLKSQQQAKSLAESVAAAEKAVRVANAQYNGGLTDFNRVALLEQNLVGQQNQYAQAQGQIALGLIQVYRGLGGGWQIRERGCNPVETTIAATAAPVANPGPDLIPSPKPLPNPKP